MNFVKRKWGRGVCNIFYMYLESVFCTFLLEYQHCIDRIQVNLSFQEVAVIRTSFHMRQQALNQPQTVCMTDMLVWWGKPQTSAMWVVISVETPVTSVLYEAWGILFAYRPQLIGIYITALCSSRLFSTSVKPPIQIRFQLTFIIRPTEIHIWLGQVLANF